MTRTMKHNALPEGMALVETADGRWFPAFASFSDIPQRVYLLEDPPLIPAALDTFHDQRLGYDCRAWREVMELTQEWRGMAARTELYPERNAWYLDEIGRLAGDNAPRLHCGIYVQVVVLARGHDGLEVIVATGNTPDEVIETLYQRVYEWSCRQQAAACARPETPIS